MTDKVFNDEIINLIKEKSEFQEVNSQNNILAEIKNTVETLKRIFIRACNFSYDSPEYANLEMNYRNELKQLDITLANYNKTKTSRNLRVKGGVFNSDFNNSYNITLSGHNIDVISIDLPKGTLPYDTTICGYTVGGPNGFIDFPDVCAPYGFGRVVC